MNIKEEILKLKKERNAVILAHYYQRGEVQEIADEVGDSFYLSKRAKECSEDVIVFCGVKFMAESAKILSPQKTVLLPASEALCPMAAMATAEDVLEMKAKHPKAKVVCYVNSSTEVKAVSDVCCTSSNAIKVVKNIDADEIIFVPDKNLGSYVQEQVPEKKIILWKGFCIVHERVQKENVLKLKEANKDAVVIAHPECGKEVRRLADFLGSTGQMIQYVKETNHPKYIVVTEQGVIYKMNKDDENKKLIPIEDMICVNMKKTNIEDVYNSLRDMKEEIKLDKKMIEKAKHSLEKMLILGI